MPLLLPTQSNAQTTSSQLTSEIARKNRTNNLKETSSHFKTLNEKLKDSDFNDFNLNLPPSKSNIPQSHHTSECEKSSNAQDSTTENSDQSYTNQTSIANQLNTNSNIQPRFSINFPFTQKALNLRNLDNASKWSSLKTRRSGSISSLLPLRENNTNSFVSVLNSNNLSTTNSTLNSLSLSTNIMNRLKQNKNQPIAQPKRRKSNSLSIIDYCTILNMNTNYQMLTNFYDDTEESMARLSLKTTRNGNIQKQATISEQMAVLFGSSNCACYLCNLKATLDTKKTQQQNIEIIPNKRNSDFSTIKYTYSTPFSQLSSLKLFNLMNTDCSIYYNENLSKTTSIPINENTVLNQTSNLPPINTAQTGTIQANLPSSQSPCSTAAQNFMLYNSNNPPMYDSKYLYLIDCRLNRKHFLKSRILTAVHFTDLLNDSVYLSPPTDNYSIIVLYDEDGSFLTSSTSNLIASQFKNSSMSTFGSSSACFDRENVKNSDEMISKIKAKINCGQNRTIHILSGGFEQFQDKFPFMCSSVEIRSTVDRHKYLTIYPNCVIESQIYIGSGIQAKNWKIIRDLRITHIINCSIEHDCVFQNEIEYLHVKIEDSYQENIFRVFEKSLKFLQDAFESYYDQLAKYNDLNSDSGSSNENENTNESLISLRNVINAYKPHRSGKKARPQPPVVLIHCNLGISRSSSILIAYLIKRYNMCLYAAFNYVKDKRLQIAPNYSFLRQLKQFEEETGTSC